jgi:hypothetical protein
MVWEKKKKAARDLVRARRTDGGEPPSTGPGTSKSNSTFRRRLFGE